MTNFMESYGADDTERAPNDECGGVTANRRRPTRAPTPQPASRMWGLVPRASVPQTARRCAAAGIRRASSQTTASERERRSRTGTPGSNTTPRWPEDLRGGGGSSAHGHLCDDATRRG